MNPVPNAFCREAPMALPYSPTGAKLFRQVTPRDPAPVSVSNTLNYLTVVSERTPALAFRTGQQRFNPSPLGIGKNLETRHASKFPALPSEYFGDTP